MYDVYSRFSSKIKLINETHLENMDSFVLIADKKSLAISSPFKFFATDLGQFNQNLNLFCTLYEKSESSKPSPKVEPFHPQILSKTHSSLEFYLIRSS